MFAWFALQADLVVVFDNSSVSPQVAAVKGPAGWLARYFGGTVSDKADWMLLAVDLLAPELAATIRTLAAN
jgi:hypothetical protein